MHTNTTLGIIGYRKPKTQKKKKTKETQKKKKSWNMLPDSKLERFGAVTKRRK